VVTTGVAEDVLQHRRQEREAGEQDHPDHEDQHKHGDEVRVAKHRRLHERMLAAARDVDHEGPDAGEAEVNTDLGRGVPVDLLAAIEHQLERADRDREHREAEEIERAPVARRPRKEGDQPHERQRPDRQVDEQTKRQPKVSVSQPPRVGPMIGRP
jgi:hypothetical protein